MHSSLKPFNGIVSVGIDPAVTEGNWTAACQLGMNESEMLDTEWEELFQHKTTTKASWVKNTGGPNLKRFVKTGKTHKEQTAEGFPSYRSDEKPLFPVCKTLPVASLWSFTGAYLIHFKLNHCVNH